MQQQVSKEELAVPLNSSQTNRMILLLVLIPFSILTGYALLTQGVQSVFTTQFQTIGGIQVFLDLVIMCVLFSVWMYTDAKTTGRRFLPWFILTLLAGSIGPLIYLLTAKKK